MRAGLPNQVILWIVQVVLGLLAAITLLFEIIAPITGGLGLGRGRWFGEPYDVPVTLDKGPNLRVSTEPALPPLGGADRAFVRGDGLEFQMPFGTDVSVWNPNIRQALGLVGGEVLAGIATLAALTVLLLIVRSFRNGQAFVPTNTRRLFVVAAIVGLGGQTAVALQYWGTLSVLQHPSVRPYVVQDAQLSFIPLLAGLGIFLVAEVFRQGVNLQSEVDQTV